MGGRQLLNLIKSITPPPVRELLRSRHRQHVFRRALKEFSQDPSRVSDNPGNPIIQDLIYGWGNDGWSAEPEYLLACLKYARLTDGAILECGSGLTTITLGILAASQARTVWSLEHDPEWGSKIEYYLKKCHIDSVRLCIRRLKDFGAGFWYDAPKDEMPQFSLVVCDGPPASTPGGRYGLLPVMKDKLKPGAVILLDDADREEERKIADRWAQDLGTNYEVLGTNHRYILLKVPNTQ